MKILNFFKGVLFRFFVQGQPMDLGKERTRSGEAFCTHLKKRYLLSNNATRWQGRSKVLEGPFQTTQGKQNSAVCRCKCTYFLHVKRISECNECILICSVAWCTEMIHTKSIQYNFKTKGAYFKNTYLLTSLCGSSL